MRTSHLARACLLSALAAISAVPSSGAPAGTFSESENITAVSSRVFNGYVRARSPDGSFRPETFAFGNGGCVDVLIMRDPTIDDLSFGGIAHMVAAPLAAQAYLPAADPGGTNLLVMVFWGTTFGSINTADGALKDSINAKNAVLLGFNTESFLADTFHTSLPGFGTNFRAGMLRNVHSDVLSALEVNRYFVVLRAFDFQVAWRQRKLRLLWETRFSLSQRRHDFGRELPEMAERASLFFGQDSHGLVRKLLPEGHVDIGDVRSLGEPSQK
jgi:hypothetical protein